MGDLVAACAILKALPYSYNLDLQEVTSHVWRALDDTTDSLAVLTGMVATASVRAVPLRRSMENDNSTAVALANYLVKEHGISFRQAHAIIGQLVRLSVESGARLSDVAATKMGTVSAKFGKRLTMDRAAAEEILNPGHFLEAIATEGGSNPHFIAGGTKVREKELELTKSSLSERKSSLKASERKMNATASSIAREVKSKS